MRLAKVTLYRVRLPFRNAFEHASARRDFSENVLVRCIDTAGVEGWGETIAREYVTGDSTDAVFERCRQIPSTLWSSDFSHADDIVSFCDAAGLGDAAVARCAVELALLDALARSRGQRLDETLAADWPQLATLQRRGPFHYSGPLGLASLAGTLRTALKLRLFGVRTVKMKLTDDIDAERRRLRLARVVLGAGIELRVDANESWTLEQACALAPALRRCRVSAVEQPFHKSSALDACEHFHAETGMSIVFDESLCTEADAHKLVARKLLPVFAVKLAKLGGFRETLRVLAVAAAHGIPVQISCQVGESVILSAAGRRLAALCPNLRWLEGSYDRFLLADNFIAGDITVGKGGLAPELALPGLGIDVDPLRVERLTTAKCDLFNAV